MKAALVQIKGDWAEYVNTFGLPSWSDLWHPCFCCTATRDQLYEIGSTSAVCGPFPEVSHEAYAQACDNCERWVVILDRRTRSVLQGLLSYDKRRNGSHGRALVEDYAPLGLLRGDRLEPCPALWDVAGFEQLTLPATVLFWRRANVTLATHRNPLLDPALGITVKTMHLDVLHALDLGVFKSFCIHCLWELVLKDAWSTGETNADMLLQLSVSRCRSDLLAWYASEERERPEIRLQKLTTLTVKMLGTNTKR
eukprot:11212131-Lingulodinium_polyedra.AAC.1